MNDNNELAQKESLELPTANLLTASDTQARNLLASTELLNSIYKLSGIYSKSSMIPSQYQNNRDNCFVAIELAGRMGVSPVLVMQNLTVVQGKPAWNGQSCIALVNGCGKFSHDLNFEWVGDSDGDSWGCFCETERKSDGKRLTGTTITIELAKKEGWFGKNGSKWQTIPQQMLMYRAAAWFARVYCPEVLMGFQTTEEVEDVGGPAKTRVSVE